MPDCPTPSLSSLQKNLLSRSIFLTLKLPSAVESLVNRGSKKQRPHWKVCDRIRRWRGSGLGGRWWETRFGAIGWFATRFLHAFARSACRLQSANFVLGTVKNSEGRLGTGQGPHCDSRHLLGTPLWLVRGCSYCCCLSLLPQLACKILATMNKPKRSAQYIQSQRSQGIWLAQEGLCCWSCFNLRPVANCCALIVEGKSRGTKSHISASICA